MNTIRTRITQSGDYVTLRHYDDVLERVVERVFSCPSRGGDVIEWRGGETRQVCAGLSNRGWVLTCRGRDELLPLVRSEWKRAASRRVEG